VELLRSNRSSRPANHYLTGDLSEAGLLDLASKSQAQACIAHFTIGVVRLSEGDRDAAREHFRKTLDTGWRGHPSYTHARAFLARLDRDPTWPKWIPVKK
jgi:hypothetical protein